MSVYITQQVLKYTLQFNNKWKAELVCGHTVITDVSLLGLTTSVGCSFCTDKATEFLKKENVQGN